MNKILEIFLIGGSIIGLNILIGKLLLIIPYNKLTCCSGGLLLIFLILIVFILIQGIWVLYLMKSLGYKKR